MATEELMQQIAERSADKAYDALNAYEQEDGRVIFPDWPTLERALVGVVTDGLLRYESAREA